MSSSTKTQSHNAFISIREVPPSDTIESMSLEAFLATLKGSAQ